MDIRVDYLKPALSNQTFVADGEVVEWDLGKGVVHVNVSLWNMSRKKKIAIGKVIYKLTAL